MPPEEDSLDLLGREPDERMLGEDLSKLPESVGRPEDFPVSEARRRIVGVGATMTGVTLIGGSLLTLVGLIETIASGFELGWVFALVLGVVFVGTHWGWVHVAEISANAMDERRYGVQLDHRRAWLAQLEPYTRWEVSTRVNSDGSITILTTRFRPVRAGDQGFTFTRELVADETHPADEPGATVTERAELLRRQAALDTEEQRQRFEAAHGAYEQALIAGADEQQRLAALRAASEALSERINANLREPPLVE